MAQLWWAVGVIFAALLAMAVLTNAPGSDIHVLMGVSSLPLLAVLATLYCLPGGWLLWFVVANVRPLVPRWVLLAGACGALTLRHPLLLVPLAVFCP